MKGKSKMPNSGKSSHGASAKGGANKGASTGLRQENKIRADTTAQPSNTNRYPNGMA